MGLSPVFVRGNNMNAAPKTALHGFNLDSIAMSAYLKT